MKRDNDIKAFLYYTDWAEAMLSLPDDLRLKIDDAIKRYVLYGEEPDDNYIKYSMYSMMRMKIEKDTEAYAERCKAISEVRSDAGKKGNEKRWGNSQSSQTVANGRKSRKTSQVSQSSQTVANGRKSRKTSQVSQSSLNTDTDKYYKENTPLTGVKESTKRTAFVPPSLDEISAYISEKGYSVDAERFFNFYEAKGWMIGKNRMKSWKAAVANWEKDEKEKSSAKKERATPQPSKPIERNYDEGF